MGDDSPRGAVLGMLVRERGLDIDAVARFVDGSRYSLPPLTDAERGRLAAADMANAPPHVLGDYPEWLDPYLAKVFGGERAEEGAALASRAPLDLRVNTIKGQREGAQSELADLKPEPTRWSPNGLRIKLSADAKSPAVHAEPAYMKGLVEIQDEGSQLVAALVDAQPGMQVADYCDGAGGKTLAIAAGMNNKGRVVALDVYESRLDRSAQRLRRAGAHNVERRAIDADNRKWLKRQAGAFDRVLVDAPCTGTGTWRRNPDGRWTLRPEDLAELVPKQAAILDAAARLVKPGGGLIYATCSVLPAENERQIEAFLERHPEFAVVPVVDVWRDAQGAEPPAEIAAGPYLRLSPLRHGTDGFFAATLVRKGEDGSDHLRHPDRSRAERGEVEGPILSSTPHDEVPRLRDPAGRSARDDGA